MPVKKIRDLQEMEDSLWREPDDPELWRAIARAWSFAARTVPRHFPPGVYNHRSIEDAQRLREAVVIRPRAMASPRSGALVPNNGRSLPWSEAAGDGEAAGPGNH